MPRATRGPEDHRDNLQLDRDSPGERLRARVSVASVDDHFDLPLTRETSAGRGRFPGTHGFAVPAICPFERPARYWPTREAAN